MDTPEESITNVHMSKKPRRNSTPEQKEQAVPIVKHSGGHSQRFVEIDSRSLALHSERERSTTTKDLSLNTQHISESR